MTLAADTFIGRDRELERLRAALGLARGGQTTTVVIGGEAGVGKSSLIARAAAEAEAGGAFVIMGGNPPGLDGQVPFASFIEMLRSAGRRLTPDERERVLGAPGAILSSLLPGSADGGRDAAPPAEAGRAQLFEAVLGTVERLAEARGPLMVVLDDLHWADRSTRELWGYLVHNLRDAGAVLVASYRSDAVPVGHPLRVQLAEMDRSARVVRFDVPRFDRDEVRRKLEAILGPTPAAVVDRVVARSDGNPHFVEELARLVGEGRTSGMPDSLRDLLQAQLAELESPASLVVGICAAIGSRADYRLLASLAPMNADDLSAVLRDAVNRNILATVSDDDGEGFAFRRTLLREVAYEGLLPHDRRRFHNAIATVVQEYPDLIPGPRALVLAVIAQHWVKADRPLEARAALIQAGDAALEARAFPEAAQAYVTALRLWPSADAAARDSGTDAGPRIGFRADRIPGSDAPVPSTGGARNAIRRRAAETLSLIGQPGPAAELIREVLETPEANERDHDLLRLGRYLGQAGDPEAALAALDDGAATAPEASEVAALIASNRATVLAGLGRYREAGDAAEVAIRDATAIGSESIAQSARQTLGVALVMAGDVDRALSVLAEARREPGLVARPSVIRPRPSRIGDLVRGLADRAAALERAGRPTEAAAATAEALARAKELGVTGSHGLELLVLTARKQVQAGEWEQANALTRELFAIVTSGRAAVRLRLARATLDIGLGAFDDAAAHLDAARELAGHARDPGLAAELAVVQAELAIWRGQLTEARDVVAAAIAQVYGGEDFLPVLTLAWLGIRAEADRAEAGRGRRATAELAEAAQIGAALRAEVVAVTARMADRHERAPRESTVMPLYAEAEWLRLQREPASDGWARAATAAGAIHDPWLGAYAGYRQAEAALLEPGGRAAAEAAARRAHASAVQLGAEALRREIEALALRARLRLTVEGPAAPSPPSAKETLGLTTREIEVLGLVARGYTNRRIAEELFITEKTAGHHVSNVLGKLDAATRQEAAAVAHRLGLLDGSGQA